MLLYAFLIAKLELVEDRIKRLRSLILSEISCNHPRWAILQRLLSSLNHIAAASQKNKMDSSNLAIIFGPSLIRERDATPAVALSIIPDVNSTTQLLIEHYSEIFCNE
jgi:adenylate kinase family enzyme